MSREERKMAQIIASIERMEQRKAATPSSASSRADSNAESDGNASSSNTAASTSENNRPKVERMNSSEIHAQVQKSTRLGAKGKKLKPLSTSHGGGVKVRSGSKKVKTPQVMVVNKREIVECKLTPKKRWIQLWNEQLSTSDESTDGDKKEVQQDPEKEKEPTRETVDKEQLVSKPEIVEVKLPETPPKPTRPTITQEEEDTVKEEGEEDDDEEGAVKITQAEQVLAPASPQADEQKEASISPVSSVKETPKDAAAALVPQEKNEERSRNVAAKSIPAVESRRVSKKTKSSKKAEAPVSSSDSDDVKKSTARKPTSAATLITGADDGLRVKTPQVTESSHLSPPLDQHSPAAAASISPSAKKDAETASSAETSSPSGESARSSSLDRSLHEAKASPGSPIPRKDMPDLISKPRDGSRKRSLERKESEPLTEEEKRRAERRRKRKSNWDVGDPRFASQNGEKRPARSPSSDGNSPSRKFPPGRPSWRHSNSMDATYSNKSSFQNNSNNSSNRASFSGGSSGPARRGFYSSNSLPLDRSRSAGRSSSSRYNYSNSNNNNSYR